MKIAIVGPGIMSIPPLGWGACESLIWDYYINLIKKNHIVHIINKSNHDDIINDINDINPDIVHIHYDNHINLAFSIKNKIILYTSHYAYLPQEELFKNHSYYNIFKKVIENKDNIYIFALSEEIKNVYINNGFPTNKIFVVNNGVRDDCFYFNLECIKSNNSIYLAKIDHRKSQFKYQSIKNIDFVGNYGNSPFNIKNNNYIGEWTKDYLYKNLTNYANLILLSDGEADCLAIKEALIAGLGIVISEYCIANLDLSKPFISVIKKQNLNNLEFIEKTIMENRIISCSMRLEIHNYGLNFKWENIIDKYLLNIDYINNNL